MADKTLKKIIDIIRSPQSPELQHAALRLAGEVGSATDGPLTKSLMLSLDQEGAPRLLAIEALGKLKAVAALPALLEIIEAGGPETELAARAAGQLGRKAVTAVERIMTNGTPVQRRRIASALAHGGSQRTAMAGAHALLDEDPGVVDAAARSLADELHSASAAERKSLGTYLIETLRSKKKPGPLPHSEAAMLRVLSSLNDSRADPVFWAFLKSKRPSHVRAAALTALGSLPTPKARPKLDKIFECAGDGEFQLAAPALMILRNVAATSKNAKTWLKLLQSSDMQTRRFAVEKVSNLQTAEVIRALSTQLSESDIPLRRAVVESLAGSKPGRESLIRELLSCENHEHAWSLAHAQEPYADQMTVAQREKMFAQACKYREKQDRRAEPLWFLLRDADTDWTDEQVEKRADNLRKKRDYDGALSYLRMLVRQPGCPDSTRFQLAAVGLKLSPKELNPEARQSDPCLGQFSRLLQNPDFDLVTQIRKTRWLASEELFYAGFHFAEQVRKTDREFGQNLLEMIVKKSPRTKLGKDAKSKLKREGLD